MTPGPFKRPTSHEEFMQLQRDTTALLQKHRLSVALNKLCPRQMTEAQRSVFLSKFASDKDIIAAAGRPDAATVAKYRARGKSIILAADAANRDVWDVVIDRSNTIGSWYTCKAALRFRLIESLSTAKSMVDEFRAQTVKPWSDTDRLKYLGLINGLVFLANALANTPESGPPEKFRGDGKSKRSVKSKAFSVRRRAEDWREQVAQAFDGKLKLLYLMQAVTGCRPCELELGVSVARRPDGRLAVSVVGAKRSKFAGQALRESVVDATSGVARLLADLLPDGAVVHSSPLMGKVDSYRKQLARAMAKVFPEKDERRRLTGYSLRHQYKADGLAAGLSREELAKAIGHSTTKSAAFYGVGVRGGSGAVKPRSVSATRPVKVRGAFPTEGASARTTSKVPSIPTAASLRKLKP